MSELVGEWDVSVDERGQHRSNIKRDVILLVTDVALLRQGIRWRLFEI